MIVCQSAPPASAPEPRLTARSMLSLGTEFFLRLLDGVVERRVAGRVTAAGARRDLDVLDQLGEQLAALGVDRRPSCAWSSPTWSGRTSYSSVVTGVLRRRTMLARSSACTRRSPVSSGWNDVASRFALPNRDDPTGGAARALDPRPAPRRPGPTSLDPGARMNTAWTGPPPTPVDGDGRPRTSRPAGRTRCAARSCRCRRWSAGPARPSSTAVGQQDHPGARPVRRHARRRSASRSGSSRLERDRQLAHRRRLAAGEHQPVDRGQLARRGGPAPASAPHVGQRAQVLADVALQGEDPDRRHGPGSPAAARRSRGAAAGSSSTLMPTIASPSPRETLAITSGSS